MAQSVGISWLWRLKSDATGSIPAGWVRGVTWVPIFLYSSILTSLRKENHLDIFILFGDSEMIMGFFIPRERHTAFRVEIVAVAVKAMV